MILPYDTPARMVQHFRAELTKSSPEMRAILQKLIQKWQGWHGDVFSSVKAASENDGKIFGVTLTNLNFLKKETVFI
jgi:hypothetical protein